MTENKGLRKTFLVILTITFLIAVAMFFGGNRMAAGVAIEPVELSTIEDGTYQGEAELDPIRVRLAVEVNDRRITAIRILEHDNGLGYRAEDKIIERILHEQTPVVDHVTGASISSKVIMKAVYNALQTP